MKGRIKERVQLYPKYNNAILSTVCLTKVRVTKIRGLFYFSKVKIFDRLNGITNYFETSTTGGNARPIWRAHFSSGMKMMFNEKRA